MLCFTTWQVKVPPDCPHTIDSICRKCTFAVFYAVVLDAPKPHTNSSKCGNTLYLVRAQYHSEHSLHRVDTFFVLSLRPLCGSVITRVQSPFVCERVPVEALYSGSSSREGINSRGEETVHSCHGSLRGWINLHINDTLSYYARDGRRQCAVTLKCFPVCKSRDVFTIPLSLRNIPVQIWSRVPDTKHKTKPWEGAQQGGGRRWTFKN